jgi:uncharacterized protein
MQPRISLITLGVQNFERALKFYRDGLGWPISSASQDDVAFFQLGGLVLSLYPRDKLAEDAQIDPAGSGFSGITLAYNAKSEAEVDEVLQTVVNLGATLIKPAQKVFWGGYSGYFADPEGHLWEVAWNPFFEFDEADNLTL